MAVPRYSNGKRKQIHDLTDEIYVYLLNYKKYWKFTSVVIRMYK